MFFCTLNRDLNVDIVGELTIWHPDIKYQML